MIQKLLAFFFLVIISSSVVVAQHGNKGGGNYGGGRAPQGNYNNRSPHGNYNNGNRSPHGNYNRNLYSEHGSYQAYAHKPAYYYGPRGYLGYRRGYWGPWGGWYGWGWSAWWGPYGYWGMALPLVALPYYWTVANDYYLYNGAYYRQSGDAYIIVNPPVGAVIAEPSTETNNKDAAREKKKIATGTSVKIDGKKYLLANGVYYEKIDAKKEVYKIVGTDEPYIEPSNIDKKYVKINGVFYEKEVDEDDEERVNYHKAPQRIQSIELQRMEEQKKPADALED